MYVCNVCVSVCLYVCMSVWMDGWMDACMHACMHVYMCVYVGVCLNGLEEFVGCSEGLYTKNLTSLVNLLPRLLVWEGVYGFF